MSRREPPIEDRDRPWKYRGGKKPFAIECRQSGPAPSWWPSWLSRDWRVWGRYKTEKSRDQALETIRSKHTTYEFRKK